MSLSIEDAEILQTELRIIQLKLERSNEDLSMIQKTTYQMLLEQVKTNELLMQLLTKGKV